jgi:hypothetical protein
MIQGLSDSGRNISGEKMLQLITRAMDRMEREAALAEES